MALVTVADPPDVEVDVEVNVPAVVLHPVGVVVKFCPFAVKTISADPSKLPLESFMNTAASPVTVIVFAVTPFDARSCAEVQSAATTLSVEAAADATAEQT